MKQFLFALLLMGPHQLLAATITSTTTGGPWSSTATWVGGVLPTASDDVVIAAGATVAIDQNATMNTLSVAGNLVFEVITARTVVVSTSASIFSGGALRVGASGSVINHVLEIAGDLTNDGTLDLFIGTAGADLRFTGINNNTFSGTGGTTDLYTMTVNKGTSWTPVITVSPSVFTVRGTAGSVATGATPFLTLTNGTVCFGGTFAFNSAVISGATGSYTLCPATAGYWLNNPNFVQRALNGTVTVNGYFRMDAGTFNAGSASGNRLAYVTTTAIEINGGIINVAGRLSASASPMVNFTMTGGTLNTNTVGNTATANSGFDLNTTTLSISGGNIVMNLPGTGASGPRDYRCVATNISITGGTLTGLQTTSTYNIQGILPYNTNLTGTQTFTLQAATYPYHLNIGIGCTFALNNFSAWVSESVVNNGVITGPLSTAPASRFYFNGIVDQFYSGSGTFGLPTDPVAGIGINNPAGATLSSINQLFANRANLFQGTIINSNKITLGNTTPSTGSVVQIGQSGGTVVGGSFGAAPTWALGAGGLTVLYLQESVSRTTGFEIPPTRTINFVTFDNTNGINVTGGNVTANNITMTNGKVTLDNNHFTLGTGTLTPAATPTNSYFVTDGSGAFRRTVTTTAVLFPVGISSGSYDPVNLTNTGTSDVFAVRVGGSVTNPANPALVVNREWDISEAVSGGSNVSMSLTYDAGASTGGSYNSSNPMVIGHYNGSVWNETSASIAGTTVSASGFTSFSPYAVGNATALPLELSVFYGKAVGQRNILNWATQNEVDVAGFEVERSSDGLSFEKIGVVAKGPLRANAYTLTDNQPFATSYYRLKMLDLDGKYTYSKVITIANHQSGTVTQSVYPTQFKETVHVQANTEHEQTALWRLLDSKGQVLSQGSFEMAPALQTYTLYLGTTSKGVCFLEIRTASSVSIHTLMRMD
jgi:hypothetical protein